MICRSPARFVIRASTLAVLVLCGCSTVNGGNKSDAFHALFVSYQKHFITTRGRVIDRAYTDERTTSEAQAYGLFFALVANDPKLFAKMLHWTQKHLAKGSLAHHLPAWLWGINSKGKTGVLDPNSASDADTWIAYTLIQAGHLWRNKIYTQTGKRLATLISKEEVVDLSRTGPLLLPGHYGFGPKRGGCYIFNMSYLPLPILTGFESRIGGVWTSMAHNLPQTIKQTSPNGLVPNWTQWCPSTGFGPDPDKGPYGSYGAIRVYLWAGMTNSATPGAHTILNELRGMAHFMRKHKYPPISVNTISGIGQGHGPVGFSAAITPYLQALGASRRLALQELRIKNEREPDGLYGKPAHYYDQNLTLFATGFLDHVFHFSPNGTLEVSWQ